MPHIGYQWLAKHYGITPVHPFAVHSEIGRTRSTMVTDGVRREVYTEHYRPQANLADQLTFAFKYEGIHLEFLARLAQLPGVKQALEEWIAREPTGAYARRAGFYYEWLTGEQLAFAGVSKGNYVDALDAELFVTGSPVNNARWRVRDNLPGNRDFCPIIWRSPAVRAAESYDIPQHLAALEADYGIDLVLRSTVWLTVKESRASFLIEREQEQEDRIRRFAAVMETECGIHPQPLAPDTLSALQRAILGDAALRYGLRRSPVFVGHTARYQQVVDYIGPHWDETIPMLQGLAQFLDKTRTTSALVRAAVASFGFVYIHPMADGNGRISRFLINDVLRRDGILPPPLILPVSATITHSTYNRADYDRVLEKFSRPLMQRYASHYRFAEAVQAEDGVEYNFHFDAYQDALPAWRYPDLTPHVAYLADIVDQTLTREMRQEAQFLHANEQARQGIKQVLEAPDAELDVIIRSVRESGNRISGKLGKRYPLLAEKPALAARIIDAISRAFGDDTAEQAGDEHARTTEDNNHD
ncbi:Fic family protein [Aquitalea sp. USM4]|uniref:Fic family protein n=1 Tax=Aquitalea sp. USM4 TaxID=1590041 RepID=UPI001038BFC8|nr:Fic family protein [Aquitalea sp. USM4]QBJ76915.1 cell filamentation protein Fic [Aquitalea sp. USM4]